LNLANHTRKFQKVEMSKDQIEKKINIQESTPFSSVRDEKKDMQTEVAIRPKSRENCHKKTSSRENFAAVDEDSSSRLTQKVVLGRIRERNLGRADTSPDNCPLENWYGVFNFN